MINASYSENTTHQPRTANIRISVAGMADQTVSVTQAKSTNGVEENQEELFRIYPIQHRAYSGLFLLLVKKKL